MPTNENFSGVSNCYVFKSRLQEYAQKVGLPTPLYETIKEGPSHEPSFRSTVIVNDVRYDSLPGFFNRKAAEQSAAEVALVELSKYGEVSETISQPVHETGLCKNLLQEYAQKMNYAIPVYQCVKEEAPGRVPNFSCTVEIGGIRYIGAAAKTKKEAEIKAARTALLAIQSSPSELSSKEVSNCQLTVIPCKKRPMETAPNPEETVKVPKAKKARFKKKMLKKKLARKNVDRSQDKATGNSAVGTDRMVEAKQVQTDSFMVLSSENLVTEGNLQDLKKDNDLSEREMPPSEAAALAPQVADNSRNGQLTAVSSTYNDHEAPETVKPSMDSADVTASLTVTDGGKVAPMVKDSAQSQMEATKTMPEPSVDSADVTASLTLTATDRGKVAPMVKDSALSQTEASKIMSGLNQAVDRTNQAVESLQTNADQA